MSTQRRDHPAIWQRTTGWGEALQLEIGHNSPGLAALVRAATEAAGDLGVRNTYARLYTYAEPPTEADPKDRFRAWLVLTALGQDTHAWGVDDDAVPPGYDKKVLRDLLTRWAGWFGLTAALAS